MRQRRSAVRSETAAARLTPANLACYRAAIYPVLPTELLSCASRLLHPGFVGRRPVDRRDLAVRHAQVDRELAAVMHLVHQHEPQEVHLADVPICLGATKNFTVLLSSASGVRLMRSTNALEDFSYVAITSGNVVGAGGILPNSIPPSRACSLAFCSVTNIHARSFAALHLACGFKSDLAAGYAFSTRMVVETSFSSWLRNCSFSLMVPLLCAWSQRASTSWVSFSKHPVQPLSC